MKAVTLHLCEHINKEDVWAWINVSLSEGGQVPALEYTIKCNQCSYKESFTFDIDSKITLKSPSSEYLFDVEDYDI